MMKAHRKKRLIIIISMILLLGCALALTLWALSQNINLYLTPSQITEGVSAQQRIRVGGLVKRGSVQYGTQDLAVSFELTDLEHTISVHYRGVLPDLFREGQGIVATGMLNEQGVFIASQVLAKHDENYQPPIMKTVQRGQR